MVGEVHWEGRNYLLRFNDNMGTPPRFTSNLENILKDFGAEGRADLISILLINYRGDTLKTIREIQKFERAQMKLGLKMPVQDLKSKARANVFHCETGCGRETTHIVGGRAVCQPCQAENTLPEELRGNIGDGGF